MRPVLMFMFICASVTCSLQAQERLPILDVHMHASPLTFGGPPPTSQCVSWPTLPVWDQQTPFGATWSRILANPACDDPVWAPSTDEEVMTQSIAAMERLNIIGVLSGEPERVARWMKAAPGRFYPGYEFEIGKSDVPPGDLRELHEAGRLSVLAEITNQYAGITPDDERMEPYWTLLEELDLPAGIHIGTGPPGAIYLGSGEYRARLHSPLTLEEVLVRHPRMRVYIMHAGYPMLDDLLAVLYAHPQVYVEVGVIVWLLPRLEFYRYLENIVNAGYGNRVMFGSDQMIWPGVIERSVAIINEAPFLNGGQKRNILYHNAARFLRLSDEDIKRHHGM